MEELFITILLLVLAFVLPGYVVFVGAFLYLFIKNYSPLYLIPLALLLDASYHLSLIPHTYLPLYSTLALFIILITPSLKRHLSWA